MRKIWMVIILTWSIIILTGCNSKSKENTEDSFPDVYTKGYSDDGTVDDNQNDEWNVDDNTIVWAFFDERGIVGNVEERVNKQLEKDGYPFRIKCVVLGMERYTQKVKECRADIVFDGMEFQDSDSKWTPMYDAILEGKFINLDNYLKGSTLYDFFPDMMWESLRVNGSIYCIPNTNFGDNSLTVAFKRSDYTEEELVSFNGTLEGLLKMVDSDRKLFFWDAGFNGYLDMYNIQNYGEYGIYYENGNIKNLMDLEINVRWISEMHNLNEHGMLVDGSKINYQNCKDEWSVALMDSTIKTDLDENEYYIIKYKGDMYPRFAGAIGIRENSHNPEYAFKMIELFLTEPKYGNLIVYGEDVNEKDGYAVDSNTGKNIYSWSNRMQWAINDGILKGMGDEKITFDSPEERKIYYKKFIRAAQTSFYDYYELCSGLSLLKEKYKRIIFEKGDIDKKIKEWIKASDEIYDQYGPESGK